MDSINTAARTPKNSSFYFSLIVGFHLFGSFQNSQEAIFSFCAHLFLIFYAGN
jgi:hypothetical protein